MGPQLCLWKTCSGSGTDCLCTERLDDFCVLQFLGLPKGKEKPPIPGPSVLCIYQVFIVVGFLSVNDRRPLRKQDDVMGMGRCVLGGLGQKTSVLIIS